jgi:hypothetical protein
LVSAGEIRAYVRDWDELQRLLDDARTRHTAAAGERVADFMREVERCHQSEIEALVAHCLRDPLLASVIEPTTRTLAEYVDWTVWVAWNVANLVIVHEDETGVAERLARAMLVYAAIRIADDGLDEHEIYADQRTVVRRLLERERAPSHASACAQAVFWGHCLFAFTLRRLRRLGDDETASILDDLFDEFNLGMLAESALDGPLDASRYDRIARRKTVAYNMMLYKPFLVGVDSSVRLPVLRALATMDWLAQFVDDLRDLEEDGRTGQMNAFLQGAYEREDAPRVALERAQPFFDECAALDPIVGDALIVMFDNTGVTAVNGA